MQYFFKYLCFAAQVGVAHTIVFHFELEDAIDIRQFEVCNESATCW